MEIVAHYSLSHPEQSCNEPNSKTELNTDPRYAIGLSCHIFEPERFAGQISLLSLLPTRRTKSMQTNL